MTGHQRNPDTGRPIGSTRALTVPRIDAHQHYWRVSREDYGWAAAGLPALDRDFLPDLLEAELIHSGIDRSVLVQVLHTRAETSWLLGLAGQYGSIAGVVGWVDLTEDPDQIALDLAALGADPKFVGVRHLVHEEPDDEWLIRSDVLRGLEVLQDAAVPFDLLLRPKHLRLVPILSERLPTLRMVIDHIAKPAIAAGRLEPWSTDFRVAASNPNVWCKLSGMVTEADHERWASGDLAPYVAVALTAFGPERLMFGSDWPVCTLAATYGQVVGALREVLGSLNQPTTDSIFGATAAAFYHLHD
jgi:L-fuconolactonase